MVKHIRLGICKDRRMMRLWMNITVHTCRDVDTDTESNHNLGILKFFKVTYTLSNTYLL